MDWALNAHVGDVVSSANHNGHGLVHLHVVLVEDVIEKGEVTCLLLLGGRPAYHAWWRVGSLASFSEMGVLYLLLTDGCEAMGQVLL